MKINGNVTGLLGCLETVQRSHEASPNSPFRDYVQFIPKKSQWEITYNRSEKTPWNRVAKTICKFEKNGGAPDEVMRLKVAFLCAERLFSAKSRKELAKERCSWLCSTLPTWNVVLPPLEAKDPARELKMLQLNQDFLEAMQEVVAAGRPDGETAASAKKDVMAVIDNKLKAGIEEAARLNQVVAGHTPPPAVKEAWEL